MKKLFRIITPIICLLFVAVNAHALMSIEEERELGEKLLAQVKQQVPLLPDPELTDFVAGLGQKVLEQVDITYFDYRFFIIQDDALNAFAMPGGLIFVHTGLLETVDSANELLCVLAHEIGHVQGRHIARRMERMKRVTMATAVMAIAGLFLGGDATGAILATSGALNASIGLKYSREDEEEADRRAYQWLCKTGDDPRGLASVFKKMQRFRWLGTDAIPSYLSTHPGAPQRITYLDDLWQTSPCAMLSPNEGPDLKKIQIKTNIYTKEPEMLIRRYRQELESNPNDAYLLYGLAQSLLSARKYEDAISTFERLVKEHPETPAHRADLGQAHFSAGTYDRAADILATYVRNNPNDTSATYYLARSYLELGKGGDALPLFRAIKETWPEKREIHFQLGRTLAALNRKGEAHYSFFRYYQAVGNHETARYHKAKALSLLPPHHELVEKLKEDGKKKKGSGRKKEKEKPPHP